MTKSVRLFRENVSTLGAPAMILQALRSWWCRYAVRRHHVEHIARVCATEVLPHITRQINAMSPAERAGYLRAKATPVVTAHVSLHSQRLSPSERQRLQRDIHDRVVELLVAHRLATCHAARRAA